MTTTASTTSVSPSKSNDSPTQGNNSESPQEQTNNEEPISVKNEQKSNSQPTNSDTSSPGVIVNSNNSNSSNSCNINSSANNTDSERRYRPQKYCAVCGDKAIACNFNAVTCESCKAFFRRNAFKETRLKCLFENRCVIDRVTRRFCSKCRLLKCFQIGMKREWILTDEQKQIKRVKIMQNKQSRSQKASASPSHSEESASPKLATVTTNNLRISSPIAGLNDSATTTTTPTTNDTKNSITTVNTTHSPTRNHIINGNSEDNNFLELVNNTRSQVVFDSDEKIVKTNPRNTRIKQNKGASFVVETRDASTSCPDEFDLLDPHVRSLQHCSFASQCQYCSLRLFGTSTPATVTTTGGQPMFVDYHQHLHHEPSHHHQHFQHQHQPPHHNNHQQQEHQQQMLIHHHHQQQQHPLNNSQTPHRVPPLYVTPLPPNDHPDHPIQRSYPAPPNHQVVSDSQDVMAHTMASSITGAATAPVTTTVTDCCNYNMELNGIHPVEASFNHHHDDNSQIIQPVSSNCLQITNDQPTSPQLHLMTPPHHISNTVASDGSDNGSGGGIGAGAGANDCLISWNNEFYGQPAQVDAELRSRLDKLEFLDSEKQVIDETIEATRFIFESNENHRVCDLFNDIVIFCDIALRRLIKTVKQIKAFRMLNMDDQIILLKSACFKILLLRSTYHFSDELDGWIDHKTGKIMTLDILKRAKKSLVYERHRDLIKKMPEPLRKDRFIMSVMAMTLLFDPTTDLRHTNSVALDNLIYLNLLRKYLIGTQPDPLNKYETLVTVLQVIKACNEEYNVFFSKDFQPEQITPLLIEIFDIPTVQCDS